VQGSEGKYILNAATLFGSLRLLVGFLLNCGLLGCQLVFLLTGLVISMVRFPKCFILQTLRLFWTGII